jgi:hypothetical protein
VKVDGLSDLPIIWMDPSNDEVVRLLENPEGPNGAFNYRWVPATPENLAHLTLPIPTGYRQLLNGDVNGVSGPTVPPTS